MTPSPRPTTPEEITAYNADEVLQRAVNIMLEMGVPFGVMLDRLFMAAAAYGVGSLGSARTAAEFRGVADKIENGALFKLEPKGPGPAH